MNQYLYHCQDCDKEFTEQRPIAEIDPAHLTCPHCGSARVKELVTSLAPRTDEKVPAPSPLSNKAHMRQPRQPRRRNAF
ncbi:MAG: zinc ribbon domain-containing protein [Terracidiphilus sp.]